MKDLKHIMIVVMVGLALLAQLMNPAPAHADDETTPPPSTAQATDVPTNTAVTESAPAADADDITPTDSLTPEATEVTSPVETATPAPTDLTTDVTSTASVVATAQSLDAATPARKHHKKSQATATPVASEAATKNVPVSEAASPTADVSSETTATDPASPRVAPVETDTPTPEPTAATAEPAETASPTVATIEPSLLDVQQQIPDNTSVVVLDENGQPVPLVTQQAADALATGDPMWCPDLSIPGGFGCTASYATMTDLLANAGTYINSQTVSGTIWITTGAVNDTSPIVIDGTTYTNWANYGLTLQGGWTGVLGPPSLGANSVFSVPITISNWNNGIRMYEIDAPSIALTNVTATNGVGVTLINVNSDVNLDTVRVENSTTTGIQVGTTGKITGRNIIASANGRTGANLSGAMGITLTGTNIFTGNGYAATSSGDLSQGLMANSSAGAVTLNNVTASNNWGFGAAISGASGVTLTGTSVFDSNLAGGLSASSGGAMTLNNITASNTIDGYGATLNSAGNLTLTGTNVFTGNWFSSLSASSGGAITLSNVTANSSSSVGAYLDNRSGTGNVTLLGTNTFNGSFQTGLYVLSNGNITLNDVTSNSNGSGAAYLDNSSGAGNVTIASSTFSDNRPNADGAGVSVFSTGSVNISQSDFHRNSLYVNTDGDVHTDRVTIDGAPGFGLGVETSGGNVTISNTRITNSIPDYTIQLFPYGDGADIYPNGGNVTVTNSEFSGNEWGLWAVNGNQLSITSSIFDRQTLPMNKIDLSVWCALANIGLDFPIAIPVSLTVNPDCTYSTPVDSRSSKPVTVINRTNTRLLYFVAEKPRNLVYQGKSVFFLECRLDQYNFKVNLPNGDKVEIYCPVSGKATITRLDNTTLPAELPTGYTFASAFQVEILQPVLPLRMDPATGDYRRAPIPVITEGGHITASFVTSRLQAGENFSVLYWDETTGSWIPLKDFMFGHTFKLLPDAPEDKRVVVSGVFSNTRNVPARVEVSTNFPGIFVLAQH